MIDLLDSGLCKGPFVVDPERADRRELDLLGDHHLKRLGLTPVLIYFRYCVRDIQGESFLPLFYEVKDVGETLRPSNGVEAQDVVLVAEVL